MDVIFLLAGPGPAPYCLLGWKPGDSKQVSLAGRSSNGSLAHSAASVVSVMQTKDRGASSSYFVGKLKGFKFLLPTLENIKEIHLGTLLGKTMFTPESCLVACLSLEKGWKFH